MIVVVVVVVVHLVFPELIVRKDYHLKLNISYLLIIIMNISSADQDQFRNWVVILIFDDTQQIEIVWLMEKFCYINLPENYFSL